MSELERKLTQTVDFIRSKTEERPEIGVILGSGLGKLADETQNKTVIDYKDIPHFPVSTVAGHKSRLVMGKLLSKDVVFMQGRFHFYEGYSMGQVVYPVRIMKMLGVKYLIVTNAAGGINKSFAPGDFMLITDHINFMGTNPLIGENDDKIGERFPDMSNAYDIKLRQKALHAAEKAGLSLKTGVYAALTGPSYETPAEIKFLRLSGADAVGMSTVPEVIAASHCGLKTLGISCITNMAAGVSEKPLGHSEVIETTKKAGKQFVTLIKSMISEL